MIFLEPYEVLTKVYKGGAHLKIALSSLPAGEKGRTVKLCYAVLEHDGYLDLCLASIAKRKPQESLRLILKIALAAMLYADMVPPVAVNEAVALAKHIGKGGAAGFVNAALRAFKKEDIVLPEGDEGLAVESNFPRFAIRALRERYGDRVRNIVLARSQGVSVRFLRGMENYLGREHLDTPFEKVKIFKNFARDEGFDRGDYTFQSVGSVAVCEAIAPCEHLLDACAAPGGKSVLLAEKCARVTACEVHPHRVALIESYIRRMGAENIEVFEKDATAFDPAWEGKFDAVLCDVPCSGLGTASENPDLVLNKNEAAMSGIVALQRAILANCSRYVKAGGALYYATCSILPDENDGACAAFLTERAHFSAEEISSPLAHEKTTYGLQFLPDRAFGAGFYLAKFRRQA